MACFAQGLKIKSEKAPRGEANFSLITINFSLMKTDYLTLQGDRWDTIAHKAYGDASKFEPLIAANPSVPVTAVLQAGIRLVVPVLESEEGLEIELLPPWKK